MSNEAPIDDRVPKPTQTYHGMAGVLVQTMCQEARAAVQEIAYETNIGLAGRIIAEGFTDLQMQVMLRQIEDSTIIEEQPPEKQETTMFEIARRVNLAVTAASKIVRNLPDIHQHPKLPSVRVHHYQVQIGNALHDRTLQLMPLTELPIVYTTASSIVLGSLDDETYTPLYLPLDAVTLGAPPGLIREDWEPLIHDYVTKHFLRWPQQAKATEIALLQEAQSQCDEVLIITDPGSFEFLLGQVTISKTNLSKYYFRTFKQAAELRSIGFSIDYDSHYGLIFVPYISLYKEIDEGEFKHQRFFGIPFTACSTSDNAKRPYVTIATLRRALCFI